jgi:hypothetical protein
MDRRIVWICLNAKKADIQNREFKHDLETYILGTKTPELIIGERAQAVRAILTLIQYWVNTGMQQFKLRERKSFEDWSAKVGGVLQSVAVEGFLDNRKAVGQDMGEAALKEFVRGWLGKYHADNRVKPSVAFAWAMDLQLDIIDGVTDDQKKSRFMKRLPSVEGRTFSIDHIDYMMQSGKDHEDNLAYYVTKIGPSGKTA